MARDEAEEALLIRLAEPEDADVLAEFSCSRGAWYEDDVEEYVRRYSLKRALANPTSYTLIVATREELVVACTAHTREVIPVEEGAILAARLQLLAVDLDNHGVRVSDGRKISEVILASTIEDALGDEVEVMTAIVAQDNLRSICVLEDAGLRSQIRHDATHIRLSARFGK